MTNRVSLRSLRRHIATDGPYAAALAGLAFVSFDRFLTATVGTLSIKPATIFFGLALLGLLLQASRGSVRLFLLELWHELWRRRTGYLILWALSAIVVAHFLSFFARSPELDTIVTRSLVIVGGALVPVIVLLAIVRTPQRFNHAVSIFVGATIAVCLYGIYQFVAPHLGLPQGLSQTATVAGADRISSFSLEPGHFASYLVTALPLVIYLATGRARSQSFIQLLPAVVVLTVIILANARGGYLGAVAAIMVTLVFIAIAGQLGRRGVLRAMAVVALVFAAITIMSRALDVRIFHTVALQFKNTVHLKDTPDQYAYVSNDQRLDTYRAAYKMFQDHPVLGVGDGNAVELLPRYGVTMFANRKEGTLNSVPMGAAAETGALGVVALAFLYVALAFTALRSPPHPRGQPTLVDPMIPRMLLLGGLILLAVNGVFLPWQWDLRLWTIVALGLAGLRLMDHKIANAAEWHPTSGPSTDTSVNRLATTTA